MPSTDTDLSLWSLSLCVQVCLVTEVDRKTCPLPLLVHPTLGDVPLGTLDMVCILHSVCMCVCVSLHKYVYTALRCMGLHVCQFVHH